MNFHSKIFNFLSPPILLGLIIVFGHTYKTFVLSYPEMMAWFVFFLYLGTLAWLFKWIQWGAALTASLLGAYIISGPGWSIWPMIFFFVSSSAIGSYINRNSKSNSEKRNAWQVLSNVSGILLIITLDPLLHFSANTNQTLYLTSIAIACSDTWGSAIGSSVAAKTIDIVTGKKIPAGVSGGISLPGSIATICGAAAIALFADGYSPMVFIFIAGIVGAMLDSFLGSRFQAQYQTTEGIPTDGITPFQTKGYRWITNNAVNFISNLLIVGLALLIL